MNSQVGVPLIVLSRKQDHVETVNRTLRDAGHPVHCAWLSDINDLVDALTQLNPRLIVHFADEIKSPVSDVAMIRDHSAAGVPLLVVRGQFSEEQMAVDMEAGAQDLVSLAQQARLRVVASRELKAFNLERALRDSTAAAHQYREQLQAFMAGSTDAIAHAQEGIVVDANPAWLELFGYQDAEALSGMPLMDLFDADSHAALKGALVACLQGKWEDHALKVTAELSDGSTMALELELDATTYDGDAAVSLCVSRQRATAQASSASAVDDLVQKDPVTGFYHRRHFLKAIEQRIAQAPRGGVRAMVWIRPDKFRQVRDQVGATSSEALLDQLATQIREQLVATDLPGRIAGNAYAVLLERGTIRDCEAWTANLLGRIRSEVFEAGNGSLSMTCSAGIAQHGQRAPTLEDMLNEAEQACRRARDSGGNRVDMPQALQEDTQAQENDQVWVKLIKAALMDNRFKLVHQPIASLQDSHQGLYDMLVRMIDESGEDVLPGEFLPAAERNGLMKNVDRWVIGASLAFVISRKPSRVFVRLSSDTLKDGTLAAWLQNQLRSSGAAPERLCFQVTEDLCTGHLRETKAMAEALRRMGFQFAVEHFGAGRDPMQLFSHVPMNYVKIDGSLMQGLAGNELLQKRVRDLVDTAREHRVLTIAERVEDANTMAVLFQLGVSYMQGHYVQEPEVVLEDTTLAWTLG